MVLVDDGDEEELVEEEEAVASREKRASRSSEIVRALKDGARRPDAERLVPVVLLVHHQKDGLLGESALDDAVVCWRPLELRDEWRDEPPRASEVGAHIHLEAAVDAVRRVRMAPVCQVRGKQPLRLRRVHLDLLDGEGGREELVALAAVP